MRKLYEIFKNEKLTTLLSKLTWSHYLLLLTLNEDNEIIYYINTSVNQNLSVRQLEKKIKNNEYERLDNKTKEKLLKSKKNTVTDFIKNPVIIKNKNNYEIIIEKVLQKLILEDIPSFLKELGDGFTFI